MNKLKTWNKPRLHKLFQDVKGAGKYTAACIVETTTGPGTVGHVSALPTTTTSPTSSMVCYVMSSGGSTIFTGFSISSSIAPGGPS